MAYVISSGDIESGIILSYDSMTILDGGSAATTAVNAGGRLYVFSGGEANSTTVNYSGAVYVESGGTADNTTVKSSGYLVASGGTAFNTTANSGALVEAVSGGNVNTATVNNGGRLFAQSKGILNRATVNPGGSLYVNPGGTATEIIENGGYVWMTNGHILVSFASNAFAGLNLVNGSATVHSGTTAVSPSVSSGGELYIYSGGTASNVVWTPCEGHITVDGGGQVTYASQYSGIYYGSNGILLLTTGTLDGKTIGGNGEMYVMAGAATTSSIVSGGRLCVASGGIASNTTVNGGTLSVASGGTANSTMVNGGAISVSSGGTANDAAIGSNCRLELSAGAVANRTVLNSWGSLYVSYGGTAQDTVNSIGQMFVSSGGYASNVRLYGREDRAEGDIYVSYGGLVEDITVEEYGDFYISSGGTANKTRIHSNGNLEVSSGGTANSTTVSSGGSMYVSSGGIANMVAVCGGSLFVLAGGTATIAMVPFVSGTVTSNEGAIVTYDPGDAKVYYGNNEIGVVSSADVMTELNIEAGFSAIVYQDGLLDNPFVAGGSLIMSGGTANSTTVNAKGSLYISSGGTANNTTVNSGGSLFVSNGGTANNTTVNYRGYASGITLENGNTFIVSSGGTANKTTVKNGGVFIVETGGIVTGITIVKDGGYVTGIVIDQDRGFTVSSGGTANSTTVFTYGNLTVLSKGLATNTRIESWGSLYISSGGTASDTTVNIGQMFVSSGGYASNVFVLGENHRQEGDVYISGGGVVEDVTVGDYGDYYISSGGTANKTTVNSKGNMEVSGGATATDIIENGGYVKLEAGAQATFVAHSFSGLVLSGWSSVDYGYIRDSASVHSGTTAFKTEIYSGGELTAFTGGDVNDTTVYSGGIFTVSSGGTANNAIVNSGGTLTIFKGGTATVAFNPWKGNIASKNGATVTYLERDANIYYGGVKSGIVSKADTIESFTVGSGNTAIVYSGGYANQTTVNSNGTFHVSGGAVDSTTVNANGSFYVSGGTADSTTVNASGTFHVSGGTANNTIVSIGGSMFVYNEGKVDNTNVSSGAYLSIASGGVTFNTTISNGGRFFISSGGTADNTMVSIGGSMSVFSGGTATGIIENGGFVSIKADAEVSFGSHLLSGLVLSNSTASATVHSGTTATNTRISAGNLQIYSSGIANETTVYGNGCLYIWSGGIVDSVKTYAGGKLSIFSGGTITGKMSFLAGAVFTVEDGAVINFDLTKGSAGDKALLNDWSLVQGTPDYTITVDDKQETGVYKLAEAADEFIGAITVQNVLGESLGTLNLGETIQVGGTGYTLSLDDSTLTLAVEAPDTTAPTVSNIQASTTELTNQNVVVTADFGDDEGVASALYKLGDNGLWLDYPEGGVTVCENGTVYFKAVDAAGNESEVASYAVTNIDRTPPEKPVAAADVTTPTNMDVLVTATFSADSVVKQYSLDGENWGTYPGGVLVGTNLTVYFRGIDAAGNASEAADYAVTNVDRSAPVITLTGDNQTPATAALLTAETDDGSALYYCVDDLGWTQYTGTITVTANGAYSFRATDAAGNTAISEILFANIRITAPVDLVGAADRLSWDDPAGIGAYVVELSTDEFGHVLAVETVSTAQDLYELPAGTYQWRVKDADGEDWAVGEAFASENEPGAAKVVRSNADENDDLFFATANGTWSRIYYARHVGSVGETWSGTGELVSANGKGRIQNLFFGSADPNVLCLTDSENGDAIFLDDVYTELPEELEANTARLLEIHEIRAGAGDDIIDMTSQRFEYIGDGILLRGGDGNDVLWANKGSNMLFGDAGNDRIIGASGSDVIAGGTGNDSMHGGGGNDVFSFCENWGTDTVEQLATGSVTLWFASGDSKNWDESTLTYTDGTNSVTVKGVSAEQVTLKFGDDGSDQYKMLAAAGSFAEFTSQRIFEESQKGMLAGSY